MAAQPVADCRHIALPGGTLAIDVAEAVWPLDRLCDFAARDNARRGFLIVSRVLGRHVAVRPSEMRASFAALAARLPANLPGPVLVVGLAETAVALGQTVHAEYRRRTGRDDTLYLHSTRQLIGAPELARFEEPHSHASAHILYAPKAAAHRRLVAAARTLVLVDDEASTGTTFANLARALAPAMPRLERVLGAVLTDWSDAAGEERVSLLRGRLDWRPDPAAVPPAVIPPAAAQSLGRLDQRVNFGRLGLAGDPDGIAARADRIAAEETGPLYLLGTGEFTYAPFLLAEALEARGRDVLVQATTRSPVRTGGAIASALRFADNYGTPVPNFLYNSCRQGGRRTLICHETPPGSIDPALLAALAARALAFGAEP